MSDYKEKYLKYKLKYNYLKNSIPIKGGLIGQIEPEKIDTVKSDDEIPQQIKTYIKTITIPNTQVIRVGSSMLKIQPYFSDVDIMNIVYKKINSNNLVRFFIDELKNIIKNILSIPNVFFSDFKAGGYHWSVEQIMQEKYGELTLQDACFIKDVVKLDIICPYDKRYIEISSFFILKSANEYINVESDYFELFKKSLLHDISHYQETKPFKAIKRVWSLARITDDLATLELLKDLIRSNIALLSQINSDIETLILLINHKSEYNTEFVLNELDTFREKMSTIIDIELDYEKVNLMIDNIKLIFKFSDDRKIDNSEMLVENLTRLHNYLLKIINNETIEYLSSINYKFPVEKINTETDTNYTETEILDAV